MLRIIALLGLVLTSACATITTGTSQSITVTSEPTQAICQVHREGLLVGAVNPTPGTLTVSRSSRDMTVRCERAGHQPGVAALPANFQAMTLGNILFGGLIGLAVDASSGAISQYPAAVHVTMVPADFASSSNRETWFEQRRREIGTQADERVSAIRSACTERATRGGPPSSCDMAVASINSQRDNELQLLQQQHSAVPTS
ncbi:MAG: hypothetical protein JWR10_4800 [Rubritepida sp.]|nr:hypothetical protein [Rubritepida sp.]